MNNKPEHQEVEQMVADRISTIFKSRELKTGSETARVDRIFFRDGKAVAIAEIKGRKESIEQLKEWGSLLITADKLTDGQLLSSLLQVPFYVIAYLKASKAIALFPITDDRGSLKCNYTVKETETKAHCEGGLALRENAFIPLDQMRLYE